MNLRATAAIGLIIASTIIIVLWYSNIALLYILFVVRA